MDTKLPTAVLTAHHVRFSWRLSSRGTDHSEYTTKFGRRLVYKSFLVRAGITRVVYVVPPDVGILVACSVSSVRR